MDNKKEYILCAAVLRKMPRKVMSPPYKTDNNDILNIEIGYRHHDIWERFYDELAICSPDGSDSNGFYTSKGRFVSRIEAMKIAFEAGQISEEDAKWSKNDEKKYNFSSFLIKEGEFKPLASEKLCCCSVDENLMNE